MKLAVACAGLAGAILVVAGCTNIQEVATIEERPPVAAPPVAKKASAPSQKLSPPAAPPAPTAAAVTPGVRESRRKGDERPEFYVVERGDTLFGIALDFGFDYKEVAAWNELADPSKILVGQRLRLTPRADMAEQPIVKPIASKGGAKGEALPSAAGAAGPAAAAPVAAAPAAEAIERAAAKSAAETSGPAIVRILHEPRAVTLPYSEKALAQLGGASAGPPALETKSEARIAAPIEATAPPKESGDDRSEPKAEPKAEPKVEPIREPRQTPATRVGGDADDDHPDWIWPAKGELIYHFGESGKLKGVGIGGKAGQPVLAAAAGKVVYSGSGLRGYGKLVIIKHSETFLSVYAHNNQILVKEGDKVKRGQRIAEMGDTDATRVALHFEIRRFGKPVDPVAQLPRDRPS